MRKANSLKCTVSVLLLVSLLVCLLTACTTSLKGKYVNTEGVTEQSFTFKEDNKVDVSAFGISVEGEYEIDDNTITFTYSLLGISYDMEKSFVKKGSSIFIDGMEFVKGK